MRECIEEMRVRGEPRRIPDHSCLMWEIKTVVNENLQSEENGSEDSEFTRLRYEIPENYLMEEMDSIDLLSKRLQRVHISQEEMDYIYQDIVDMMKRNLKEVVQRRGAEKRRGQVWYHRGLQKLRKTFDKAVKQWLESRNEEQKKARRETYLEIRRSYNKAVRRAKREHEEKESDRLEATLRDPKKWWRLLSKKRLPARK